MLWTPWVAIVTLASLNSTSIVSGAVMTNVAASSVTVEQKQTYYSVQVVIAANANSLLGVKFHKRLGFHPITTSFPVP